MWSRAPLQLVLGITLWPLTNNFGHLELVSISATSFDLFHRLCHAQAFSRVVDCHDLEYQLLIVLCSVSPMSYGRGSMTYDDLHCHKLRQLCTSGCYSAEEYVWCEVILLTQLGHTRILPDVSHDTVAHPSVLDKRDKVRRTQSTHIHTRLRRVHAV